MATSQYRFLQPATVRKIITICNFMRSLGGQSYPREVLGMIGDDIGMKNKSDMSYIMSKASKFGFMKSMPRKHGSKIIYKVSSHTEVNEIVERLMVDYHRHMESKSKMAADIRPKALGKTETKSSTFKEALSIMGKLNGVNHAS